MLNLAIFVSGRGSNFRAIHSAILSRALDARIRLLVSSTAAAGALEYARDNDIPVFIEPPSREQSDNYPEILLETLYGYAVDFIALCGYMKLLPAPIVGAFRNRVTNIHPALLPSFGGKGMYGSRVHEAVLASGAKYSGATVHVVNEEYDRGPIVLQAVVPVGDDDTADSLAARVLAVEHDIYPKALALFADERIIIEHQRTRTLPAQAP